MNNENKNNMNMIIGIVVAAVVVFGAWAYLNQPDDRTMGQRLEDAGSNLDEGLDDAARELQDRTPLERAGDEIEDATDGNAN